MELNELNQQLQVKLHQYFNKFENGISRPEYKFIRQVIFGILKTGSVQVASIGRGLSELITQKKTTDRLGHHLGKDGFYKKISELTLKAQRYYLRHCRYLICDISDIRKVYARKMEGLSRVHDGSEDEIGDGYWLCNVVGVDTEGSSIVPAYSELYSLLQENSSENSKILEALNQVYGYASGDAISVLDRGGDREVLINSLLTEGRYFIIRQRGDRCLTYRGKRIVEKQLSRKVELGYSFKTIKRRKNRLVEVKYRFGAVPVRFKSFGKKLYFVVAREEKKGYCWFLCHLPVNRCEEAVRVAFEGYSYRWKIEEVNRQVKGDYNLESICLQRYEALKTMNALFWSAMSFLYTRLESLSKEILFQPLLSLVKKNRLRELFGFIYYKLALGTKLILAGSRLYRELILPSKIDQLSLDFGYT